MLSLDHFLTPPQAVWVFTNILVAQEGWDELFSSSRSYKALRSVSWVSNEPDQKEWALLWEANENTAAVETKSRPKVTSRELWGKPLHFISSRCVHRQLLKGLPQASLGQPAAHSAFPVSSRKTQLQRYFMVGTHGCR